MKSTVQGLMMRRLLIALALTVVLMPLASAASVENPGQFIPRTRHSVFSGLCYCSYPVEMDGSYPTFRFAGRV